jgi:hypothetical protein
MIFTKTANIPTSFATDQNSVSLGMLDIAVKNNWKNFVCRRFHLDLEGNFNRFLMVTELILTLSHSKLDTTYAATDKLSFTAGYMGTFIG